MLCCFLTYFNTNQSYVYTSPLPLECPSLIWTWNHAFSEILMSPNYYKSAPSHTIKAVKEIMRPLTGWTHFCMVRNTVLLNSLPLACDIYGYPAIYPQLLKKNLSFFKFPHEKWSYLVEVEKNVEELVSLGWLWVDTLCLQSVLRESEQQF